MPIIYIHQHKLTCKLDSHTRHTWCFLTNLGPYLELQVRAVDDPAHAVAVAVAPLTTAVVSSL